MANWTECVCWLLASSGDAGASGARLRTQKVRRTGHSADVPQQRQRAGLSSRRRANDAGACPASPILQLLRPNFRRRVEPAAGYRFDRLFEAIITTPQFLNKRGRDDPRGE